MALTVQRDMDAVVGGFVGWLSHRLVVPVEVVSATRPTAGWSGETVLVRAHVDGRPEGFAVRLPPVGGGIFPTYDLGLQARAQNLVRDHGVPAPGPVDVVEDRHWLDDPFLVMPLVDGHVPAEVAATDPWVRHGPNRRRRALCEGLVDVLVRLHGISPDRADDLPRRGVEDELAWWADYLDWCADGDEVPAALTAALTWCGDHRPATEPPPAVLWGDVRLGNVVFADDDSIAALLDWEMASVGAPEHDLAWWWALEALADDLVGARGDGFPSFADLRLRYETGLGRPLQDLAWFETFALFRSASILTRIGLLQARVGLTPRMPLDDNPVLDHLTRRTEEAP